MHRYGCSLKELQEEWTIPQALEFGKVAAKSINNTRLMQVSDMALAFAATQSKEGNKSFQKLVHNLSQE